MKRVPGFRFEISLDGGVLGVCKRKPKNFGVWRDLCCSPYILWMNVKQSVHHEYKRRSLLHKVSQDLFWRQVWRHLVC